MTLKKKGIEGWTPVVVMTQDKKCHEIMDMYGCRFENVVKIEIE